MIPFLIDLHGYCQGEQAQAITEAARAFKAQLEASGATFPIDDQFSLATVRHAWLYSRNYWEQDSQNPSRNDQRSESIQVTENLMSGSRLGAYEHLKGR